MRGFSKRASVYLAIALASTISASATPVFVGTPAGLTANDSVGWSQLGGDQTALAGPFSATSVLGDDTTGNFSTDNTGLVAVVCPTAPTCSWSTSGTGMNAGDSDIWAFDNGTNLGTGPLTLAFSPAVLGAGAWIEGDTGTAYTASIQAFDGITSLAPASTVTSDGTGDPVFLGLLDSTADITSVVFSLTSCSGCAGGTGDFAIDTLLIKDSLTSVTPEPSAWLLLSSGLAGMAMLLRRREICRRS